MLEEVILKVSEDAPEEPKTICFGTPQQVFKYLTKENPDLGWLIFKGYRDRCYAEALLLELEGSHFTDEELIRVGIKLVNTNFKIFIQILKEIGYLCYWKD